jgi:hypothetical protein
MSLQELQTILNTAETAMNLADQAHSEAIQAYNLALANYNTALTQGIQSGTVGSISSVTTLLLTERNAGIQSVATFLKANPTATQAQVIANWTGAATVATGLPSLLQDPTQLCNIYTNNLHQLGAIPDTTWQSFINWIIATPIEEILAD